MGIAVEVAGSFATWADSVRASATEAEKTRYASSCRTSMGHLTSLRTALVNTLHIIDVGFEPLRWNFLGAFQDANPNFRRAAHSQQFLAVTIQETA